MDVDANVCAGGGGGGVLKKKGTGRGSKKCDITLSIVVNRNDPFCRFPQIMGTMEKNNTNNKNDNRLLFY